MDKFKTGKQEHMIFPMGLTVIEGKLHFSTVFSGDECNLLLYEAGNDIPFQKIAFPVKYRRGDVWSLTLENTVSGDAELEYCYECDGTVVPDPYGKVFTGRETWGDLSHVQIPMRTRLLMEEFDWEGDKPPSIPYEDSIIYRAHVRGMTKHVSSKVRDKGTFKALLEKIPYLKELGITSLELMPVTEFEEVIMPEYMDGNPYGECRPTGKLNYWGYTKSCYFAPKASYSSGHDKHPVEEFKMLVRELHKAGIEIIVEMYFKGSENPAFVLDAVRYWVQEYHLDGIHLVGFAPVKLIGHDPYLKGVKLFATSFEEVRETGINQPKKFGEYNDGFMVDMRRALKGDEDQMNQLIFRSRRNPSDYGVINYMAHTNGFTLMDMVSYDMKHNEANGENNQDGNAYNYSWNCGVEGPTRKKKIVELRRKQLRNAILLLFLSQGTPLLLAGDEFGNSKNGNNNSYCQDNEISWLNWNQLKTNKDIYEFVRYAIAFRKKHPVFHMPKEPRIMDYLACGHPDLSYHGVKAWCPEFENFRRQIGVMYCGQYAKKEDGTPDNYFYVAYNMHWEAYDFSLPNLPKKMEWFVALNTDDADNNGFYEEGEEKRLENQKQFVVAPRTIIVFIGKVKTTAF